MNFLRVIRNLKERGILGMNARNGEFLSKYNKRKFYPMVDDKLMTKDLAKSHGISVPELYHVVTYQPEVEKIHTALQERGSFVIKPSKGSGGEGVLVINGRAKNGYRSASGRIVTFSEVETHLTDILSGLFSLGGQPDRAMVEYKVEFDPAFEKISYLGVPDIRIIVFLGVPVMAMVRLPTRISDGKANLHQGAVGAGISIAEGETISAVLKNQQVEEHPDTGESVIGVKIPNWEELLRLSTKCYALTGLGYIGVDIVLDRNLGPLVLELNARPGLAIQIANNEGLLPRLKMVEEMKNSLSSDLERIEFAMENFHSVIS